MYVNIITYESLDLWQTLYNVINAFIIYVTNIML